MLNSLMQLPFAKMHALGNDFIIIDGRDSKPLSSSQRIRLANRQLGIGCDQILVIESSQRANYFCRIYNTDGSEAEQCGNGLRALGWYLNQQKPIEQAISIETLAGVFLVSASDASAVTLSMLAPNLANCVSNTQLPVSPRSGVLVNLGNPHCIVALSLENKSAIGEIIHLMGERFNLGFMELIDRQTIKLLTHERGSGFTLACGSNAIAATLAGISQGILDREVTIRLQLGELMVRWPNNEAPLTLTGPVAFVYEGNISVVGGPAINHAG